MGDNLSYCGGCSVQWGVTSVQWGYFSTVEVVQYSGDNISTVGG